MLSLQEVGTGILGGNPKSFYILGGEEYGVKKKYIDALVDKFGNLTECPTMSSLINMLSKKHIIPLQPAVYVVRYDETFVAQVSPEIATTIHKLKFEGTIICLYEQSKQLSKLDKYFPNNLVIVNTVDARFLSKYLHTDFPQLPNRLIDLAVYNTSNYSQAQNMCRCMCYAPLDSLYELTDSEILKIFGFADASTESEIRLGVASRDFNKLVVLMDNYDNLDSIIYTILQTMIELDKLKDNKYAQSDVKDYAKYWTREDIYYMFVSSYEQLKKLRSSSSVDSKSILIYLFALLKYSRIPAPEVMN